MSEVSKTLKSKAHSKNPIKTHLTPIESTLHKIEGPADEHHHHHHALTVLRSRWNGGVGIQIYTASRHTATIMLHLDEYP